jgi:hypothetical protein
VGDVGDLIQIPTDRTQGTGGVPELGELAVGEGRHPPQVSAHQHRHVGRRRQSTAGSALTKERVIAAPQPDINASGWADRFDGKHPSIARRRRTHEADNQTLEHRRFGQSLPYSNRLKPQLELRIDSTLDAGTCGHVEHRLT